MPTGQPLSRARHVKTTSDDLMVIQSTLKEVCHSIMVTLNATSCKHVDHQCFKPLFVIVKLRPEACTKIKKIKPH